MSSNDQQPQPQNIPDQVRGHLAHLHAGGLTEWQTSQVRGQLADTAGDMLAVVDRQTMLMNEIWAHHGASTDGFRCAECCRPWPCDTARLLMRAAHQQDAVVARESGLHPQYTLAARLLWRYSRRYSDTTPDRHHALARTWFRVGDGVHTHHSVSIKPMHLGKQFPQRSVEVNRITDGKVNGRIYLTDPTIVDIIDALAYLDCPVLRDAGLIRSRLPHHNR